MRNMSKNAQQLFDHYSLNNCNYIEKYVIINNVSCKFLRFLSFCSFMLIKFRFGNIFDSDLSIFLFLAMLYIDYNLLLTVGS